METDPIRDILIRTSLDKQFREAFVKDPVAVLLAAGVQVPPGITIEVLENTDSLLHIVLPTDLGAQPSEWVQCERPMPGELTELPNLTLQWTDLGVALSGRITSENAHMLRRELERSSCRLVVDFKQVEYMGSAGLGVLLATQKRLTAGGFELYLSNMPDRIRNVFSISALDSLFKFVNPGMEENWWMTFPNV